MSLNLGLEPALELCHSNRTMGKLILLFLIHFGICFALVLKDGIPP